MLIHNAVECSSGFRILTSQSALGWLWCNVRKATRKCHLVLDQVITLKLKAQIQPELNSATTEMPGECMACHEATLWRHCWLQWNCQISNIWKYFRFLVSAAPISAYLRRGPRWLLSQWMLHWWRVSGSAARGASSYLYPCWEGGCKSARLRFDPSLSRTRPTSFIHSCSLRCTTQPATNR